jgi:hypothetical protein
MYPAVAFLLASTKVSVGSLPVVTMSGRAESLASSGSPAWVGTPPPVFEQGSGLWKLDYTHTHTPEA